MKKIIALYRRGERGKTETLNLVIDMLQVAATGCPMPAPQSAGVNRKETIFYKGQIISICTAGDNENELLQNEVYFDTQKCDVAITAARSHGKTHNVIKGMESKYSCPPVIWVWKQVGTPNVPLNVSDAKIIIGKI